MDDILIREDHGPIARLVLNSPARFNALSTQMIAAMADALQTLAADETIRVVVIAARGKAFSAGHDLRQMQAMQQDRANGPQALAQLFRDCAQLMQSLPAQPQPVIAEVQGIATAAGCQLVASCDMAVAATTARFGVNGVSVGLFCATPMVALTRAVPAKAAFEMLTTGDFIGADRARDLGLINRVAEPQELTRDTMALAASIAAKPPQVVRMGKRAFYGQQGMDLAAAYDLTAQVMCQNMALDDTAEGIAAFVEKRPPNWT